MKNTKNYFIISLGVYPFDVFVYFGSDLDNMFKLLSKYICNENINSIKSMSFTGVGKSIMTPCGKTILWLRDNPSSIDHLSTLSHEIFHCVCFVLNRIGIEYSEHTDEAYAYLIGFLTKQIYSKIGIHFKS